MGRRKKLSADEITVQRALAIASPLAIELKQVNERIEKAVIGQDEVGLAEAISDLRALAEAGSFDARAATGEELAEFCFNLRLFGYSNTATAALVHIDRGRINGLIKQHEETLLNPKDDMDGMTIELSETVKVAIRSVMPGVLRGKVESIKALDGLVRTMMKLVGLDVQKQLHGWIDSEGREVTMLQHPAIEERRLVAPKDGKEDG